MPSGKAVRSWRSDMPFSIAGRKGLHISVFGCFKPHGKFDFAVFEGHNYFHGNKQLQAAVAGKGYLWEESFLRQGIPVRSGRSTRSWRIPEWR